MWRDAAQGITALAVHGGRLWLGTSDGHAIDAGRRKKGV
jgi:hypothetical protein